MSDAKHTPGPWRSSKHGYISTSDCQVAIVGAFGDKALLPFSKDRWSADARLIAAAPDLLEALVELLELLPDKEGRFMPSFMKAPLYKARTAIAKAEGRDP